MSLQLAAKHLASQGRGPDSMLIHMSPKEVESLQAIARAHGGSLSINPETGLVEAGFLKNLLPMIAGMGITALTGGAAAPWMIGLGVGGVQAARTGSLEKGLMAGLGAYGGAGLGTALSASAGTAEAANSASNLVGKAVPPIEQINPSNALSMGDKLKYGIQGLGTEAGRSAALNSLGGGFNAAKTTAMALAPALMDSGEGSGNAPKDDERYVFDYKPGRVADPNEGYTGAATGERTYFRPSYTRLPNAKGMAEGGAIPYDSSGVARFDDGGATEDKGLAAAAAAQGVQPFTGQVPFNQQATPAMPAGNIQPVANNPYYTMSGQSGDAYRYLMGLGPTSGTSPTVAAPTSYQNPTTPTTPTTGVTEPTSAPTTPPPRPYTPPAIFTPSNDVDDYDQDNQDAIDKIEQEVADEQYDQDNQDAIDKIEQEVADEQYDQDGQDAINKYEQEIAEEQRIAEEQADEFRTASDIDDETISIEDQYDQENQDAIDKIEQEVGEEKSLEEPGSNWYEDSQDAINKIEREVIDDGGAGSDWWFDDGNDLDDDAFESAGSANGGLMSAHSYAMGGSTLGGYSDGGRLLRGPGDGVSDSIPASIGRNRQPARLADGEFVVPARIVSELGNGSTEAGARKLYAMMDRIQKARRGSVGKGKVAKNTRADRYLPA